MLASTDGTSGVKVAPEELPQTNRRPGLDTSALVTSTLAVTPAALPALFGKLHCTGMLLSL